jgi:hypothetical protein
MRYKGIKRDELHHEFEELLQKLQPDEKVLQVFQLNLQKQIEESGKSKDLIVASFKNNLKSVEDKIQRFIERIGKTEDENLISNYENELKKLYAEKEQISDKIDEEKNRV